MDEQTSSRPLNCPFSKIDPTGTVVFVFTFLKKRKQILTPGYKTFKFLVVKFEMRQLRFTVLLIFLISENSADAEVTNEIETLKTRVTYLENEVSILKTEKDELLTVKSDVSFLLEKNSEIMEMLTKMRNTDEVQNVVVQSNAIASVKNNENLSYLQTISGIRLHSL